MLKRLDFLTQIVEYPYQMDYNQYLNVGQRLVSLMIKERLKFGRSLYWTPRLNARF